MKIILFILYLTISIQIFAQNAPDTLWTNTIGGINADDAAEICETTDGGFIIAGYELCFYPNADDNFLLIKINSEGSVQWERVFGGSGSEKANSVQQTSDGGFIIAGYTNSFGLGLSDIWLIKTDENGMHQWDYTYGSNFGEEALSVKQTADNGYIIAGDESIPDYMGLFINNALIIKTDQNGVEQWRQSLGNSGNDVATSVQQTLDGGFIVAGYTNSEYTNTDFWIVKLDAEGIVQWEQTYGGNNTDRARSITQTSDGGYILVGVSDSFGLGDTDCLIVKFDNTGMFEWEQILGNDDDDTGYSIQPTLDDGFIIAGYTKPYETFLQGNIWINKIDENGILLWDKVFVSNSWEVSRSALQTTDGGYIISGFTQNGDSENRDIRIIRLGSELDSDNFIIQDQYLKLNNYPNPFNPSTTIMFSIQNDSFIDLAIYNLKGQKIKSLLKNNLEKGQHSINWNSKDDSGVIVASGIYFYKLIINGKTVNVRKCILLK